MRALSIIAWLLVVIGAINWGLVGIFGFNAVSAIFGTHVIGRVIYVLVGLAGLYSIALFSLISREWEPKQTPASSYRSSASAPPTPTSTTPTSPTI